MSHKYPTETKAAVLAAILAGQAVTQVATQYGVPQPTVSTWKRELKSSGEISDQSISSIQSIQKKDIGELILHYMQVSIETLTAQAEFFKDATWLKDQSAENVAVLHGVMADKLFRMIEALGKAYAASDPPPQD